MMGTGVTPAPWFEPPAGRGMPTMRTILAWALPSGTATDLVPSPDFTCIRPVCLPSFCAS
jgi:hypothetical protein